MVISIDYSKEFSFSDDQYVQKEDLGATSTAQKYFSSVEDFPIQYFHSKTTSTKDKLKNQPNKLKKKSQRRKYFKRF